MLCLSLKNRELNTPMSLVQSRYCQFSVKHLKAFPLSDHISEHSPLSMCQWGFQHGKSTVSALLSTIHDWFQLLERGIEVGAVLFDFQKVYI